MTKLTYEQYKEMRLSKPHFAEQFDTPRKLENALKKAYEQYSQLYNLPLVKKIVINLPIKSSKTWGYIISGGEAEITYVNGQFKRVTGLKASGYGYDKACSVVVHVLNEYARQNLLDYEEMLADEYASKERGFDNQKLAGAYKSGDGALYYSFGDARGDYFNFSIAETAYMDDFRQYTVTFKNGATGKMYGHKVAPRKKRASPAKKCPIRVDFRRMI